MTYTASNGMKNKFLAIALAVVCLFVFFPRATNALERIDFNTQDKRLFDMLNSYRVSKGSPALIWCENLRAAASGRSEDLGSNMIFGHFTSSGESVFAYIKRVAGIPSNAITGENIMAWSGADDSAKQAYDMWINSPGHAGNLIDKKWTHSGTGGWQNVGYGFNFTQVFSADPNGAYPCTTGPSATPTATPSSGSLREGDVITATGDIDVFIVNQYNQKRLFLNPIIFSFYQHLGFAKVKPVSTATRDSYATSGYFRNCEANDQKVFAVEVTGEDKGILHHLAISGTDVISQDPDFAKKVFCINSKEFDWYPKSIDPYTNLNQVPKYGR